MSYTPMGYHRKALKLFWPCPPGGVEEYSKKVLARGAENGLGFGLYGLCGGLDLVVRYVEFGALVLFG